MFNLHTTTAAVKKSSKKASPSPPSPPVPANNFVSNSLEPAIDGPPSPERIRAYTEQMKRSSLFGPNSRTNTLSSASSSFRSRESNSGSTDNASLSRRSSGRSNRSSMPSSRSDRPESVQLFGSIFSRGGRKSKRENSAARSLRDGSVIEEETAQDHYYGTRHGSRRRHLISEPYNFQHVTHTRQDHLPNLQQTTRTELVSEFSAIRASQAPTNGELKGIRAEDLHFQNFSSEALASVSTEELPQNPQRRAVLRKSIGQYQRSMPYAKSHDNLRTAPPRPPRSPLSPECPVALPARTSSRTASVLFETFDPPTSTIIERPYNSGDIRRPAPFNIPLPPPPSWVEEGEISNRPLSHAVTTPGDEAWPLMASPSGNFGAELTDVKEEDEEVLSKTSRFSTASAELRMSRSVPALRRKSLEQTRENDEMSMSANLPEPDFPSTTDSWESDIDWCYEHEVEADDNYDWDPSTVGEVGAAEAERILSEPDQPALQLRLQNEERTYHGRFRPSLLVPLSFDLPELSPMSASTMTPSDPRTPSGFLRPGHIRSPSHASSFKESHGFNLSPSLLIPSDFQSQVDEDVLYNERFNSNDVTSAMIFMPEPFMHSASPIDEGSSSTASFRSSNFSRTSANSRGSQDSILLLARASDLSSEHRIGSASSLPDLVPSACRLEPNLASSVAALKVSIDDDAAPASSIAASNLALASPQHRRNASLAVENGRRKGVNHFAPPSATEEVEASGPVKEFPALLNEVPIKSLVHGRKISAPESPSVKQFKGRARAKTSATRGSYMLFPQI